MISFQNSTEFKSNIEFDPDNLRKQGWREVDLVPSIFNKVLFSASLTVLVILFELAIGAIFFLFFGSNILFELAPIYLSLLLLGVFLHELVHVLFFPRNSNSGNNGNMTIALCRATVSTVILNKPVLTRRNLMMNLLAPLWVLSVMLFGIAFFLPQYAGQLMLLACGNAAWAGTDVALIFLILCKVQKTDQIHLSSISRLSVFLR
jgi:hypothetical protein